MYVPAKSPFEAPAVLRSYLEREFAAIARFLNEPQLTFDDVRQYGALGDDGDDTAALAAAAAASRNLYFPPGIYNTTEEIYFDSSDAVHIRFAAGAVLKTIGATNRAFHFDGAPASSTSIELVLEHVVILGANSGVADCAIFLDQIALFWLHNTQIFGEGKFVDGIYGYGAQQGEISGGYIRGCSQAPIHIVRTSGVPLPGHDTGSNGIDIHGVSLSSLGTAGSKQFLVEETDSVFFHHNHMIGAEVGVEVVNCQSGCRISNNHIEAITGPPAPFDAGILIRGVDSQGVRIDGNVMFGLGDGLRIEDGSGITVDSNSFIFCDLTYETGVSYVRTVNNYAISATSSTFTDNSTFGTKFGNRSVGGAFDFGGASFDDTFRTVDLRVLELAPGSLPAAGAAQDGRVIIEDNGAGDRNLIIYSGGQRFRIDGGAAF